MITTKIVKKTRLLIWQWLYDYKAKYAKRFAGLLLLRVCQLASVVPDSATLDCSPPRSCPWDSPDKNAGVGCHALLQGVFPTQGSNPHPLHPALAGGFVTTSGAWEALCSLIWPQTGLPLVMMMPILSISWTLWIHGSVTCLSVRTGTPLLWALIVVQSLSLVWLFGTHGVRHARLPCPSPSPGVCSHSLHTNCCCQFLRSLGLR